MVNDVDVTAYVDAELDRQFPERAQVRQVRTADDFRAGWSRVEQLWSQTTARAERLPAAVLTERVHDEWSFTETLRHLIFASDAWAGRTVGDQERPYHPYGLSHTEYQRRDALAIGLELDGRPSYAEVLEVRQGRQAQVRRMIAELPDADLDRQCARFPAPGYPEEHPTVGQCLRVVTQEECEHRRYAERDLAVLEGRAADLKESAPSGE